ncbi:MAG TPA: class I SAM-dependent methyltransferase [Baekduia sp.]|uniref:O-methyltransferase n=1 Tax=Baekduia sp. TaxID=2600305 RepID=UPI002D7800CD|nr:class I SAM-dependent methyltransferase [Baekduia sp.]HET6509664.1 class I SAM-dependent methyltransferase [Baekduia sp.]
MDDRLLQLLDDLHREGREHDAQHDDRLLRLRNLEPETGALLNLMVRTLGARAVLELGTSNGYSTIWLAEAVAANRGRVTSVELDPARAAQAARNLARARLADFVDLQIGDAGAVLAQLPDATADVVFLDAERPEYPGYWDDLKRVTRRPALLACDNALSHPEELAPFRALVDADPDALAALDHTGAGVLLILLPA